MREPADDSSILERDDGQVIGFEVKAGSRIGSEDLRGLLHLKERLGERLEEAILICKQMWSGSQAPFDGKHYHLARTLNSPQALSRPHPPILIGGAGEKKTLRLVARYADACNIAAYDPAQAAHKLEVLREHCATEGRDYGEIEKTAQTRFDLGENGENVQRTIESLHEVAEMGFTVAHGSLLGVSKNRQFDLFAERIIPALEKF